MKEKKTKCNECGNEVSNKNYNSDNFICNECLITSLSNDELTKERDYVENLFVGRFNYYLISFSIIITAGFANSFIEYKFIVFYFGALLLLMSWLPLIRAYKKLNCILTIIFGQKKHVTSIIESVMRNDGFKHTLIISRWMGIYIPLVCIVFLLVIGIVINIGLLK